MQARWMTACLDTPRRGPGAEAVVDFWQRVTATWLSPRRGQQQQFATLVPAAGDGFLRVQDTEAGLPGCHLDLHVDDVRTTMDEAVESGAALVADLGELVLLRSPNGLPFCLVEHLGEEDRSAPVTWQAPGSSEQVSSLVDQLCIDVSAGALDSEVTWWSGLLGWGQRPASSPEFAVLERPAGQQLRLLLQRRAPSQAVRSATARLDMACTDRSARSGPPHRARRPARPLRRLLGHLARPSRPALLHHRSQPEHRQPAVLTGTKQRGPKHTTPGALRRQVTLPAHDRLAGATARRRSVRRQTGGSLRAVGRSGPMSLRGTVPW